MQTSLAKLPDLSLVQTGVHHSQSCHSLKMIVHSRLRSPPGKEQQLFHHLNSSWVLKKPGGARGKGELVLWRGAQCLTTPHLLFAAFRVKRIVKFLNTRKTQISVRLNFQCFQEGDGLQLQLIPSSFSFSYWHKVGWTLASRGEVKDPQVPTGNSEHLLCRKEYRTK